MNQGSKKTIRKRFWSNEKLRPYLPLATWKLRIALAALVLVVVALVAGVFLFPKARAVGITKYAINAGGNWSAK